MNGTTEVPPINLTSVEEESNDKVGQLANAHGTHQQHNGAMNGHIAIPQDRRQRDGNNNRRQQPFRKTSTMTQTMCRLKNMTTDNESVDTLHLKAEVCLMGFVCIYWLVRVGHM